MPSRRPTLLGTRTQGARRTERLSIDLNQPHPELPPAVAVLDEMRERITAELASLDGAADLDAVVAIVRDPTHAAAIGRSTFELIPRERILEQTHDPDWFNWLATPPVPGCMRVAVRTNDTEVLCEMRVGPIGPSENLIVLV